MRKLLLLSLLGPFFAFAAELSAEISQNFVDNAPELVHVHSIPFSSEETDDFCLDLAAATSPGSTPNASFSPIALNLNRDLQTADVCRVEFFLEFAENINWTDIGIFDTGFFLCTDIFDFFQGSGDNLVSINDVLSTQICEFCIEGDQDSNKFVVLGMPQISGLDIFDTFYSEYDRNLQTVLELETEKSIQVKGKVNNPAVNFVEVADFAVTEAYVHNSSHIVFEFNQDIHFIRSGVRSTEAFETSCSTFLQNEFLDNLDCRFSIVNDKFLLIGAFDEVPSINQSEIVIFFTDETPFYAIEDRFGLKEPQNNSISLQFQPLLSDITQTSVSTFQLQFSEPMLTQDIGRTVCVDIVDFMVDGEELTPYFAERLDYFCTLSWTSNTTATLEFVENTPVIFSTLVPVFNEAGVVVGKSGFGVPVPDVVVVPDAQFPLNVSVEAFIQPDLSKCDTEILITLQVDAVTPVLITVVVENIDIVADGQQPSVPEAFCRVIGTVVKCDLEPLNLTTTTFEAFEYSFDLVVEAVGLPSDNQTNEQITSLTDISFEQNIGEVRIPIDIPGVSFEFVNNSQTGTARALQSIDENGQVTVKRGLTSTFTAVVGDIFGCISASVSQLDLQWQVFDSDNTQVFTKNGKILRIPGDILEPGIEHEVRFTASLPSQSIETAVAFSINVAPADIVLVPEFGTEQTVSNNLANMTLSVLRSCNPNKLGGADCQAGIGFINDNALGDTDDADLGNLTGLNGFDLLWSCLDCGNISDAEVFAGVNRTNPVAVIPLANLEQSSAVIARTSASRNLQVNNNELQFVFTATDPDGETTQVIVGVTLLEPPPGCIFPAVSIAPVDGRVNANSAVALQGSFDPPVEATFKWEEESTSNFKVFEDDDIALTKLALFIPADSLEEDASYTFKLNVRPICDGLGEDDEVPSALVSFDVNRRPFGGFVDIAPEEGTALDDFVLTTSGWQDADGDLPLQFAFEVIYIPENEDLPAEFDPQQTTALSQFSLQSSITTKLQVAPPGTKTVIIAVAKDALGAVSRRVAANANDRVVIKNPFVNDNGEVNEDVLNVDFILGLIQDLQSTGDVTQVPNLCSAISSSLNALSEQQLRDVIVAVGADVLEEVRFQCFNAVSGVVGSVNDADGDVDSDVVNLVAGSLTTITEQGDQLNDDVLEQIGNVTSGLVENMQDQVTAVSRGAQDPTAGSIIPQSFKQNVINTVSNILGTSESVFGNNAAVKTSVYSKRRLQALDPCLVLGDARTNVVDLTNLETSVVTNGAPAVNAAAQSVSFSATRENVNDVGVLSKFLEIVDANGNKNDIELPAALAEQLSLLSGNNDDLNILAAKWNVLIRCEERSIEEVECREEYKYVGPRRGSEGNIVSLDFFPFDGTGRNLTVEEIAEPIVVFLDVPEDIASDVELIQRASECQGELDELNAAGSGLRELVADIVFDDAVCGFFDESSGDFITTFCNAVGIERRNGEDKLRCECFHATDYAAWNAFRYDVKATLVPQGGALSDLAKLVFGVFFPIVLLVFLILLIWAYRQDKKDAQNIIKGALARVKLMRIIKLRQKRQFFDRIKIAQVETIMKIHDSKLYRNSHREPQVAKHHYFLRQFLLAVKYEHSLFGLSRYDPNFSRVQRVWIFISVVVSSFGSAGILFQLRGDSYAISVAATVGISFLSALMVSVPVKFVARALFKTTENKRDSKEDQVNNMYKVITRVETADGVETETDKNLVEAIYGFHVAEERLNRSMRKLRSPNTEHIAEAVAVEDDDEIEVAELAETYVLAKRSLGLASERARTAWKEAKAEGLDSGRFYSSWSKLRSVRNKSSTFLKTATLFSGEASKTARARESRLPHFLVIFDYSLLAAFVLFYAYFTYAFVRSRADRANDLNFETNLDPSIDPISEGDYISEWAKGAIGGILISYLVAEPVIALIRYVILPLFVSKCSKEPEEPEPIDLSKLDIEQFDEKKEKSNIRDSYAHYAFDLASDLMESLF